MGRAKEIVLRVIPAKLANKIVIKYHYSGSVVQNSQLHFGVFLDNKLEGVMSFGPSLQKKMTITFVKDTKWNEFIELNRMAFSPKLPKNSESRAIAIALKLLKKNAPHIKWVISYADGCQSGTGTIYRAAGFILFGIKKNDAIFKFPNGMILTDVSLKMKYNSPQCKKLCKDLGISNKYYTRHQWKLFGAKELDGNIYRYIYFLDKEKRKDLQYKEISYSSVNSVKVTRSRPIDSRRGSTDLDAPKEINNV